MKFFKKKHRVSLLKIPEFTIPTPEMLKQEIDIKTNNFKSRVGQSYIDTFNSNYVNNIAKKAINTMKDQSVLRFRDTVYQGISTVPSWNIVAPESDVLAESWSDLPLEFLKAPWKPLLDAGWSVTLAQNRIDDVASSFYYTISIRKEDIVSFNCEVLDAIGE